MRLQALLLAGVLLGLGCRSLPGPLVPLAPDDPRPRLLLETLDQLAATRSALRGRAELSVDSDDGAVQLRGRQVLALARPDRLRVEVLGFLGQTQAVLATDGGHYQFLVPAERHYESGTLYRGLLWEVARIDLEPIEVVELLLGVPLPDGRLTLSGARGAADGALELELTGAGGTLRETLAFDAAGRLRRLVRYAAGERLWEVSFDGYGLVEGTPFAHDIALEFQRSGTRAQLSLRDVELNPELPDALFQLPAPATWQGAGG